MLKRRRRGFQAANLNPAGQGTETTITPRKWLSEPPVKAPACTRFHLRPEACCKLYTYIIDLIDLTAHNADSEAIQKIFDSIAIMTLYSI